MKTSANGNIIFKDDVGETIYVKYTALSKYARSPRNAVKSLLKALTKGDPIQVTEALVEGGIYENFAKLDTPYFNIKNVPKIVLTATSIIILWIILRIMKRKLSKRYWALIIFVIVFIVMIIPPLG